MREYLRASKTQCFPRKSQYYKILLKLFKTFLCKVGKSFTTFKIATGLCFSVYPDLFHYSSYHLITNHSFPRLFFQLTLPLVHLCYSPRCDFFFLFSQKIFLKLCNSEVSIYYFFSVKVHILSILSLEDQMVSLTVIYLCSCSMKAAIDQHK